MTRFWKSFTVLLIIVIAAAAGWYYYGRKLSVSNGNVPQASGLAVSNVESAGDGGLTREFDRNLIFSKDAKIISSRTFILQDSLTPRTRVLQTTYSSGQDSATLFGAYGAYFAANKLDIIRSYPTSTPALLVVKGDTRTISVSIAGTSTPSIVTVFIQTPISQ